MVILAVVIEMITNVMILLKMNIIQKNNPIFRNLMNQKEEESIGDEVEVIIEEIPGGANFIKKIKL